MATAPRARTYFDSNACRGVMEGTLRGDIDAAIAAINPNPTDLETVRDVITRMANALSGLTKGKAPRLERTLPDIHVENYPTALQIWSFGDKEVYFVGCLMRVQGKEPQINLYAHPFVDEVVKNLKSNLGKPN